MQLPAAAVTALGGVSASFTAGRFSAIMGPSGLGNRLRRRPSELGKPTVGSILDRLGGLEEGR
jgi:ABC-type lipoprotein export system ATPase subunit